MSGQVQVSASPLKIGGELVPNRLDLLAVSTPRGKKLDESSFAGDPICTTVRKSESENSDFGNANTRPAFSMILVPRPE